MDTHLHSDAATAVRESVPSSETVRVRFGELDGLRALAVIAAVVWEATRFASPAAHWPPVAARVFADCGQGISLFFLLSGFVLAYPALATLRQDGCTYLDVGRYLVRRVVRFYPAYLVVLGLTIVVPPLAMQYGLPALAAGGDGLGGWDFVRNALFAGSGLANDGFRILALEARWCLLFPALLLLWARAPRVFLGTAALVAAADLFVGAAHGAGFGSLLPFMLGIAAADVRAGHLRFERLGFIVAGVAALAAVLLEPYTALLPGPAEASTALRFDPLWALALFGLLTAAGTSSIVERVLSLRVLRLLGAASFGISLVMVPVSNFVVRQILSTVGQGAAAVNAGLASIVAGFVIWQLFDRWFAEGNLRRDAANLAGPWLDAALRLVRADRVPLGAPPVAEPEPEAYGEVDPSFYAPPPRPAGGDLAIVSMRSGSPQDLAAEIMEMKKRLSERSNELFAEAAAPEPEPEAEPVATVEPFAKPGFYRRQPAAPAPAPAPAPAAASVPPPPGPPSPPAPAPAPPRALPPRAPAAASNVTPIRPYVEPQPISLTFESAPSREYVHFTFEPPSAAEPPPPAASTTPVAPAPPAPPAPRPVAPTSRGPIKMRLGPPVGAGASPSTNGNGKPHKVNGLDG
jgi:peptidoglycan/LPS O-acetylase OafA/YrhL